MTKAEIITQIENVVKQLKDDSLRQEGMIAAYSNMINFLADAIEEPKDEELIHPEDPTPVKEKKTKE